MSLVERRYNEALYAVTGHERAKEDDSPVWLMLALQIQREHGDVDEQFIRVKTPGRLYMSDKQTQRLLERVKLK